MLKFSELEAKVLGFIDDHRSKIIGILIGGLLLLGAKELLGPGIMKPTKVSEFAETSVILMDAEMKSGGSGVILRSESDHSVILTNKHVCKLLQGGGVVAKNGRVWLVDSVKRYPMHDLCMVRVSHNFNVNTKIAPSAPEYYEEGLISGHPALLPHVLTKGSFSGHQIITLVVGLKECKEEDYKGPYGLYCVFIGGLPIFQSFDAQLVTGTILPGSSGSGVFNAKGEISGLVFAGNGQGLGYAFIVPWEYVNDFMKTEKDIAFEPVQKLQYDAMIRSIFNIQKDCVNSPKKEKYKNFCNKFQKYLIQELK